jgi:hypothetical protein
VERGELDEELGGMLKRPRDPTEGSALDDFRFGVQRLSAA